ncbi:hypothetical protein SCHPADRAFT_458234 [Schizopora paradoxa]|uniref:Uncharacterized protein n=1 Tax=Schizopora paradoxa TaxID=27342 RepID=A0A0H2RIF0_9AGAM|nr:hypothetical protein SCHPADRAFT_458234 [Schizopora paradoxa]
MSISVDRTVKDWNGRKMEIKGKHVCRRFCESVQSNARVASIVRELRLGSTEASCSNSEESYMHAQIIRLCRNVENITLYGISRYESLEEIGAALSKTNLVFFQLYEHPQLFGRLLGGYLGGPGPRFPPSAAFSLVQRWPRLQRLRANLDIVDWTSSLKKVPLVPGSCFALTCVYFVGAVINSRHLQHL